MAPDLNAIPPSPRNPPTSGNQPSTLTTSSSRRASQIYPMNPPPLPLATPGGTIPASVQQSYQAFPPLSPVLTNISISGSESGPSMPMRHPQPMTPAELHLELEKEQEAVVCTMRTAPSPFDVHKSQNNHTNQSCHPGQPSDPRTHRTPCALGVHRELGLVDLDFRHQRPLSPHRFTASPQFLIDVSAPRHTAEQRNSKHPASPSSFASSVPERCCRTNCFHALCRKPT